MAFADPSELFNENGELRSVRNLPRRELWIVLDHKQAHSCSALNIRAKFTAQSLPG